MVCYFQSSPVTHVRTEYEQVLVSVLGRFPFKPHFPSTFHLYKKQQKQNAFFIGEKRMERRGEA